MEATQALGLLLCDDLMFASRITATARSLGLAVRTLSTVSDLEKAATETRPTCVIVDLANPTLDMAALAPRLRSPGTAAPLLVAYGSHVDTATLTAARDAGCDIVLPRSKFVADLTASLPRWVSGQG